MKFHHIYPTNYINDPQDYRNKSLGVGKSGDLLLAHLIESDPEYKRKYNAQYTDSYFGTHTQTIAGRILDNSAFELYRAGLPMFDGNKMVELGKKVGADYLVLPDYPGQHPVDTIEAAIEFAPKFKQARFGTFFVPQGRIGSVEDYIRSFAWAATSDLIDYIGISIIAGPNAFGVDQPGSIQTYLARLTLCQYLFDRGLIELAKKNGKKIHFLGMTDGPNEIKEAMRFPNFIDSWDSSAAVWAGINDIRFDNSPTGLIVGKVKSHVDFAIAFDETKVESINYNVSYIDKLVSQYNVRG